MVAVYRSADFLQAQTPGARDARIRARHASFAKHGVGSALRLRLTDPERHPTAARAVIDAGGSIEDQGEFCPGEPYLFARDRDGYLVEIWYEIPTPVDPH